MVRRLIAAAVLATAVLLPSPAHADSHVTVSNPAGDAKVDPTYATTLRVSGNGFQSIKNGHGGIYVFFGTVTAGWQPSRGGATGADYFYVPDSEDKFNQGFQKYVAFPGSDTASSANGGTMSASGSWSTTLVVPGATFQSYDRAGNVHTVDCRKVTCGVITVGAHGVVNSHNETFTPITVGALAATGGSTASADPTADPTASTTDGATTAPTGKPGKGSTPTVSGPATLEVDRDSAAAGNVLAFIATGLTPGAQVSAVFDDGAAAAGPFVVGPAGQLAGVVSIPASTGAGTHELRLYGVDYPPSLKFAVRASEQPATAAVDPQSDDDLPAAVLFAGAAALILVLALVRLGLRFRKSRRATA